MTELRSYVQSVTSLGLWVDSETYKNTTSIFDKVSVLVIKSLFLSLLESLFPMESPGEKSVRKTMQRMRWQRQGDRLSEWHEKAGVFWPNVKLLEQFGCLVYLSASHPGLTKARIYQQTAEDNFQQHCAQSKGRDSNDLIKPFEPERWSDFLVSHRLSLLCSSAFLTSALSGETVVMVSRPAFKRSEDGAAPILPQKLMKPSHMSC